MIIKHAPASLKLRIANAASAAVLAANPARLRLRVRNLSESATVSLAFSGAAILGSGITLEPRDIYVMDESDFSAAFMAAISNEDGVILRILEFPP